MQFPRKSLFLVTFAGTLLGTPALASGQVPPVLGGMADPPVRQLATRVSAVHRRGAKRRAITWWKGLRVRDAAARIRASAQHVRPRLALHDSYPRGPPLRPLARRLSACSGGSTGSSLCGTGTTQRR
jgi:hypothetical protein